MDCSLPGSSVHGDFPGKITRVGCHALLQGIIPTQDCYGLFPWVFLSHPSKIRISLNYYHSQRMLFWMKLHVGPKHKPKVEYWTNKESETRLPPGSLMMTQDCNGCLQARQNHPEGEWLGFSWETRSELPEGIHTSKWKMCKIQASPVMCLQVGALAHTASSPSVCRGCRAWELLQWGSLALYHLGAHV